MNGKNYEDITAGYAAYELVKWSIAVGVILVANVYLFLMALHMRALFREFNLVKGYGGEAFLVGFSLIYLFFLIYQLLRPVITMLVYSSDFSCSPRLNDFMQVISDINSVFWPLSIQALFVGIMWQLSRI
jgi:hypothetical protein